METALSTLAQVFVGPLVGTISDHYGPAILEKIGIKWDVNEEMEKLSDILLTIQDVLEDAEDKQTTSKPIRNWLRKLKDVAYDVEDLLDECATEALYHPESTGIIDRATMVERIKQLINKFDKITEQRYKFNLISLNSTTRAVHYRIDRRRETSSFPTELNVYGRDEVNKDIVNHLINNTAADLSVYAIVGITGIGKTTLAQMVYNDNMVKNRFQIRRWVCVSENFEVKSLIEDTIQSRSKNVQTLEQLQRRLQNILSGKRFLLVLDDVWNEDQDKWERFKLSLTCGSKGSSIIVTTRSDKVASLMCSSHVCHPKNLSEEDCFSLFKRYAFAEVEGEHYPNLESIGKQIVKKCGGVPSAAKALGGLLRFQREEKEWLFVKESNLWDLPQDKVGSILPALRLSYKHLPQHLRQCFAYCSIFPKDYRIEKDVLIQLWMANGFFQPKGSMELEDIGNGIFNDLLWKSLFQDVEKDIDGNIVACKMHNLVHDLACSITRGECFSVVTVEDKEQLVGKRHTTRHLKLDSKLYFSPDFALPMSQSRLRTLLHLGMYHRNHDLNVSVLLNFSNLLHLRVLDLGYTLLNRLPESIGKLKHLRYLDLSKTAIDLLPDEIFCNLRNLQTLKLCGCYFLERLPGNMSKLTNLRHFDITGSIRKLVNMPVGMGQLKCLHMLSHFIVSEDSGCGVGELQGLDHLGGTLAITCLWKVRDPTDAENAELIRKQNIRHLHLDWSDTIVPVPQNDNMHAKLIADALQPHPNLVKLEFHYYGGSDFPSWMNSGCLVSLVEISLIKCLNCKNLPTLGMLPCVKVLKIIDNRYVECIGNEFYFGEEGSNEMKTQSLIFFPALEELSLSKMHSLEEWKGWSSSRMKEGKVQVSVFPVLKSLIINDCPNLRTLPSLTLSIQQLDLFPVLKTLRIYDCPNLRTLPLLPLSIRHLILWDCSEKIFERSLESLPHLSHLSIRHFLSWSPDRGTVVLHNLTALQKLEIIDCPMLVSLPEGTHSLTSLKSLTIHLCDGLKSLNNCLQLLTNLHELSISDCGELEWLPDDLQNLIFLQSLSLDCLPKQGAVPVVGSLTLDTISFNRCLGLMNLPEWITNQRSLQVLDLDGCKNLESLPEGLQHLTALQLLYITGCHPELYRRCQEETGEDWHKIAHIPKLFIRLEECGPSSRLSTLDEYGPSSRQFIALDVSSIHARRRSRLMMNSSKKSKGPNSTSQNQLVRNISERYYYYYSTTKEEVHQSS